MIRGYVDEQGAPMVTVTVVGMRAEISLPALVDTGFDGDVCLPVSVAVSLGLELTGQVDMELADGTIKNQFVFRGEAHIGGQLRTVEILLTELEEALIGRSWYARGSLSISSKTDRVVIEEDDE